MYHRKPKARSAMEYAQQTLTEAEFTALLRLRQLRVEQYARTLGRPSVGEAFDMFFWSDASSVDEWRRLGNVARSRRVRQFSLALSRRAQAARQRSEREAALLLKEAVNDDAVRARAPAAPTPIHVPLPVDPDADKRDDDLSVEGYVVHEERPKARRECPGYRPCPYVSCRYHLYLDVTRRGRLRLNFPDTEVIDLDISCALDLSARGPKTLEQIGLIMGGISRERVRQIEQAALEALRRRGGIVLVDFLEHGGELTPEAIAAEARLDGRGSDKG